MGLTLAKIAKNVATISLNFAGENISIEYYPSKVTEKTYATLSTFATMTNETVNSGFEALNSILKMLIKSWDVFEEDEVTMYPLTQERLSELPILFRTAVLQAILSDIRPETLAPQNSQN